MRKAVLLIEFVCAVMIMMLVPASAVITGEQEMGMEVEWAFNSSAAFPGLSFGAGHQGPPAIYDVDKDGEMEIYYGTRRGDSKREWCLNGADGTVKWIYPPISEDGLPGDPTTKVSFVDVNNDGSYEICLAGRGGVLHVIKPDGSVLWTWENPITFDGATQAMHGAPQAYDVDGDGSIEFFLEDNAGYVQRISNTGQLVWTSAQSGSANQGHPTIADIDQDGDYECLYASPDHNLYCISADTGEELWKFDMHENPHNGNVIVADVNHDGEYEAITWTDGTAPSSGKVYIVSFFGSELARWTVPQEGINIRMCQAMGDVDGDGNMEMALNTGSDLFVIDVGESTPMTEWELNVTQAAIEGKLPMGALADSWSSYQIIVDFDGDGAQEIIWTSPFPIVTDGATGAIEGYYVNDQIAVSRRAENGAGWGDVDGDGISEYVVELNGPSHPETMVYCLTANGKFPADAYWPEYFHSSMPVADQLAASWLKLKGAYSNSMWFPMPDQCIAAVILLCLAAAMHCRLARRV